MTETARAAGPTGPMTARELRRYADAIVVGCLRLGPGELLAVHGQPEHRELMVALVEAGYRVGARYVDVVTTDPRVKRARIEGAPENSLSETPAWHDQRMRHLIDERAAVVTINGEGDPDVLADVDPRRAALERSRTLVGVRPYLEAVGQGTARFCVVAWPTPAWAALVFPEAGAEAERLLAEDLLHFARLDEGTGTTAWDRHVAVLAERAARLTALDVRGLELRGPGTALDLAFPAGTVWGSAEQTNAFGQTYCANLPTEEVFTSPDPARTQGTFRCSRPLSLEGRRIDGIEGEFRDGRLLRIGAHRPTDRLFLEDYFARDEGAGRLGEVALLDRGSRIGQTGRVYDTTLLDENAASHIAFGRGFDVARHPDAEGERAVNASAIHVDVMIGSEELEVTAVTAAGARVPLIAGGDWQL